MSYAQLSLHGFRGFGAAAQTCGAHSHFNATTGNCDCDQGFDWANPSDPKNFDCKVPECNGLNEAKSPIDSQCHCIPGFRPDANDTCSVRGLTNWFPNCVDSDGKPVPGCVKGYSVRTMAPWVAGGAIVGLIIGAVLF